MSEEFHKQPTLPGVPIKEGPEPPIPKKIGDYSVEGHLGKGGTSRIYLGVHPQTHQPVAIKVLLPQYPELKERFLHEAKIIEMADHPNIIKLYDEGEWEGGLYIAMEFIQGMSLRQLILQNPLGLRRAIEVVLQIASALEHLHSHGVIHRDVKPENILLTSDGGIKVVDFGIAQLGSKTTPGIIGTPVYMSPEKEKSPASDIFSLGMVAYELLLGKLSFGHVHLPLLPKNLQPILAKALQPDPAKRYTQVSDFAHDLSEVLNTIEGDEVQDLAHHIRTAQERLLPKQLPQWPHISLGLSSFKNHLVAGLYYDFIDLDVGHHTILLAEPASKGVEGVLHAALLQGVMRAVDIEAANRLLCNFDEVFALTSLTLDPVGRRLDFLSCGYGPLYLLRAATQRVEIINAHNVALGIDPETQLSATTHNWAPGDTLVITTFRAGAGQEEAFVETLSELFYTPPQQQAETILRRVMHVMETEPQQRPITVITAHHNG